MTPIRATLGLIFLLFSILAASTASTPLPEDERAIVHVLNRIGFGPKPGDVEKIRALGLRTYIDRQLHPEKVSDSAISGRLQNLTTLALSSRAIAEQYERPILEARREQKQATGNNGPVALPQQTPAMMRGNQPLMELAEQKVIRAIYSDRQLQEALTDFWFNHFNVDARKGPVRFYLTEYERDAIRPRVLGRFRDLLGASAQSPAMLFYLDNWMSADPNGPHVDAARHFRRVGRPRMGQPSARAPTERPNMPKGLNENYGRELLELHTLGVDGGYTQKDVTEVARAFTGWSIANPRAGGGFRFVPALHDDGEKVVLGHRIKAHGGVRDGEEVLDILAAHPSTARFISGKLARRFISDTPPDDVVDRAADAFRRSNGDLRAVMTVLLTSREFLSPDTYRGKVKTPFDFMVSAVRAMNADVTDARSLVRAVQQLGMPLYQCQPPTGYKDTADAWVNTGALVNRMNTALALASGRMPSILVRAPQFPEALVAGGLSDVTRGTIAKATTSEQAAALALGSPEFQRR